MCGFEGKNVTRESCPEIKRIVYMYMYVQNIVHKVFSPISSSDYIVFSLILYFKTPQVYVEVEHSFYFSACKSEIAHFAELFKASQKSFCHVACNQLDNCVMRREAIYVQLRGCRHINTSLFCLASPKCHSERM